MLRQRSPLSVAVVLAMVMVIAYASLYPLTGWRDAGIPLMAYIHAPINWHLYRFDFSINILGYIPLGFMLVLALYPAPRGLLAVLLATILGAALSCAMETLQNFLPTRVSSQLDLYTNGFGTLVGALLAWPCASSLIDRGWLRHLRLSWFERGHSVQLMLALMWPFSQLYPQPYLFANGDFVKPALLGLYESITGKTVPQGNMQWLMTQLDLSNWIPTQVIDHAQLHQWGEMGVTASAVLGAAMFCMCLARSHAPQKRFIVTALLLTLIIKSFVMTSQFRFDDALNWATPGALSGLLIGICCAMLASYLTPRGRWLMAWLGLLLQFALTNLMPVNPFYEAVMDAWSQGKLIQINQLAHWLSWSWPVLALTSLLFGTLQVESSQSRKLQ